MFKERNVRALVSWLFSCQSYFAVAEFLYPKPQLLLDSFPPRLQPAYVLASTSSLRTSKPGVGGYSVLLFLAKVDHHLLLV